MNPLIQHEATPLFFVAVFVLSTLCATAWGDTNRIIHVISTCTAINNFVDIGPPGPTTGDLYVWVDDLFTTDGSQKVGEAFGRCNLIDPAAGSFGCTIVGVFNERLPLRSESAGGVRKPLSRHFSPVFQTCNRWVNH
jgi:hypothetical protein